jgi:hypothetical protein
MSKKSSSWRTRTRGSSRQIGSKFQIKTTSMQGDKAHLPRITGHIRGHLDVTQPKKVVRLELIKVKTARLVPRESHPVDLDVRANYFVDLYKHGETIPPILVHRLSNGRYVIIDGHARVRAAQILGLKELPAVENDILQSLGKGARKMGKAMVSGARIGARVAKFGARTTGAVIGATVKGYREARGETQPEKKYVLKHGRRITVEE